MEVGGDWFDMIELGDGSVVLAMGDVVGRGVRAAALMGKLRTSLEAYAFDGHHPPRPGVRAAALMGKLRTSLEAYAFDGHSPAGVADRLHALMERQHRADM